MLNEKSMPNCFWVDGVATAIYLINRCPTARIYSKTPEEVWSGKKPDLSSLKIFGCICYVHIPQELRTKLDAKSEKCIFVGYSLDQKGFRCYNPVTRELLVNQDVIFDELSSLYGDSNNLQIDDL